LLAAGLESKSLSLILSLIMDSVHNLSDEVAPVFLYLAFALSQGVSRNLVRSANVFNAVGMTCPYSLFATDGRLMCHINGTVNR
jgi:hypothetical protein